MARAFDTNEKRLIHESILKSGCRLFGKDGFSKTTVDAIAAEAGIAKGTFYQFWDSKEAFFFACMEETELRFQEEVIEPLLRSGRHPADIMGALITETLGAFEAYPIIQQALDPVLLNRLTRKIPPEILERHQEKDRGEFAVITAGWDSEEFDPGIRPEILDGMFKGLLMMGLHRNIIGSDIYPEVAASTARVMRAGLKALSDERIGTRGGSLQKTRAPKDQR